MSTNTTDTGSQKVIYQGETVNKDAIKRHDAWDVQNWFFTTSDITTQATFSNDTASHGRTKQDTSTSAWTPTATSRSAGRSGSRTAAGGQAACNESKMWNNDEKALFHGIKSAFRMSRAYDGSEYGSENPQHPEAALIAAHVAKAYLLATDQDYDRERSFDDLSERHMGGRGVMESVVELMSSVMADGGSVPARGPLTDEELEEAIKRAWEKIDSGSHVGGARVALAAAEVYLGEHIWPLDD